MVVGNWLIDVVYVIEMGICVVEFCYGCLFGIVVGYGGYGIGC